jgi:hypothetical protein
MVRRLCQVLGHEPTRPQQLLDMPAPRSMKTLSGRPRPPSTKLP